MRFLLDTATILCSVARKRLLVTVEKAPVPRGFGGEIVSRVVESLPPRRLKAAPVRVGAEPVPTPYARPLEPAAVPDAGRIRAAVLRALGRGVQASGS